MSWFRLHRRSALLVLLTVAIPAVFVFRSLFGLAATAVDYAGERARLEPRLARLEGLLAEQEALEARSREAQRLLRQVVFPPEQDATALAATLQAEVRQIMDVAGLEVSNSQVMPVRRGDSFEQVPVKLTVEGPLAAFDAALIGIAAYRPQLLIESLDAFPSRGQRRADGEKEQSVTAVLQLMALRQVSE